MLHIIGNTDTLMTLPGVRSWIKSLKWKKTEMQRPWFYDNEYVGEVSTWGNYQIATI